MAQVNQRWVAPPVDLSKIEDATHRLTQGRTLRMRFDALLEQQFHLERGASRRRQLIWGGLAALIVFNLFLVSDWLTDPHHLTRAIIVRLGVITPLVLVTTFLLRKESRIVVQETAASMLCTIGCGAVIYLHTSADPATALQVEPGVLLVLLAMNTLLRPDLWVAIGATACCYGMFLHFLLMTPVLSAAQRWNVGGRVFWFAVLSLVTTYMLSRERRLSWLLQLRGRMQASMLADSNRQLLNLSLTDPLTSLPNRAAYEKRLPELWQEAIRTQEPIAALMVDVDHFKNINDTFGHLYGDRVLQRVASLMEQALRAEADFAARFGGEEFVVLLPCATLDMAQAVAERIRVLVEVAGSPAVMRSDMELHKDMRWSTVSCGVASVLPAPGDDMRALIDTADAALYAAKQSGRNRVCVSSKSRLAPAALSTAKGV